MSQEEQIHQLTQQLSESQTANSNLIIENTKLKAELETLRPSQPAPEENTTAENSPNKELLHRLDEIELSLDFKIEVEPNSPENRVKAIELCTGMKLEDTPDIDGQELIHRIEAIERFIGRK